MTEEDLLIDKARLGIEAEKFLNTPTGKCIQNKANNDLHKCMEAILNPANQDIQAARDEAMIIRAAMGWIVEIIDEGLYAEEQLKEIDAL